MTEAIQVVAIGVIGTVLVVTLQQQRKEMALLLSLIVGTFLLWKVTGYVTKIVEGIRQIAAGAEIAGDHLKLLLKLLAISYVTELGCEICKDAGQQSLASKIQLGGKVIMLAVSLPIFQSLLAFVTEMLT